ncbi:MAG: cytochrome P450 [Armatimonadota bacterium]
METLRRGTPAGWKFNPLELDKLFNNPGLLLSETRDRVGDPFTVWSPGQSITLTGTPTGARAIFSANPRTFSAFGHVVLSPFLGDASLIVLSGDRHKEERRLLMPPLHGDRMRIYGAIIQDAARTHLSQIPAGAAFTALTLAQDVTLDIIIRAVFGVENSHEVAEVREAITTKLDASTPWLMFFPALRRPMLGIGPWDHFLKSDVNARRLLHRTIAAKRLSETRGADILSLLLDARHEDGSPMPNDDIVDELITLLFAGHETTAITLAWAMYWLHAKPELLERLQAELAATGSSASTDEIAKLPFLSALVDETLRIHPVVPLVPRVLEQDFELGGWLLPKGSAIGVSVMLLHQDPDIYPDPTAFNPDRFLGKTLSPFEYAPFGGGARRCIGAAFAHYEAKLVLAEWLRTGTFSLIDTALPRLERRNITLAPRGGVQMRRVTK